MKRVSVLGAGMVGSAIARDLNYDFDVTSYDMNIDNLNKLKKLGVKTVQLNLSSSINIKEAVKNADYVVNATPGFMGFKTLKEIIINKKDVIDIAFYPENSLELGELAKENGITAIVDIGIAPGMSNFILGYHANIEKINEFVCYVGGLPEIREYPFQYKAPFSPIDVIEEYIRPARIMENGRLVTKPALTDREYIFFENIGTLEAFNSDGLRTLIDTINVPNMIEKTLRYPGHIEMITNLKDMGFLDNKSIIYRGNEVNILDFVSNILIDKWKLSDNDIEFTIMKIVLKGETDGKMIEYTYDLYDRTDSLNGVSSMARTTGYTATAALNLLHAGLFKEKGLFPPEKIAINNDIYKFIFRYLEKRGVNYKFNIKYL